MVESFLYMKNSKFACFLIFVMLLSCNKEDVVENSTIEDNTTPPGVLLTFDDDYVEDWKKADDQLKDFDWKATFCVCRMSQMNPKDVKILQDFQKYGHEIAGHGANHVNTLDYIALNGFQKFYDDEITPMMYLMNKNGLNISSFAYPYGVRNKEVDDKLFNTFQILRGTTYGSSNPANQSCYFENSKKLVFGLGIDSHYSHFSMPYVYELLDYANSHHKILILYSHKPVEDVTENYQTKMENLVSICKYVKLKRMKFYTLSDLPKIKA